MRDFKGSIKEPSLFVLVNRIFSPNSSAENILGFMKEPLCGTQKIELIYSLSYPKPDIRTTTTELHLEGGGG